MSADDDEMHACETSHKGEKSNGYTMQFKQDVIIYVNENSNRSAEKDLKLT